MKRMTAALLLASLAAFVIDSQAVPYLENWETDAQGWTSAFGNGTFNWVNSLSADPGTGALNLEVGASETGTFGWRADINASGGNFMGDYSGSSSNAWRLYFYAEDVLPSTARIQYTGGAHTYFYNILPQITALDGWNVVTVPLWGPTGWLPPPDPEQNFWDSLTAVSEIQILFERGGSAFSENYYIDLFEHLELDDGDMTVPEPHEYAMIAVAALSLALAMRFQKQTPAEARSLPATNRLT